MKINFMLAIFLALFLQISSSCYLYTMDDSAKKAYLERLLQEQRSYDLQRALYEHFDSLHTPWIGSWISENLKNYFWNIVLLYFDVRWYISEKGLKPDGIDAFFNDVMMLIFRFFQDSYVCYACEMFDGAKNYNFLINDKIFRWTKKIFFIYGEHANANFGSHIEKVKRQLGINNIYKQGVSYTLFFNIPESPTLACSMQRSAWSSFGLYSDTIYFLDPKADFKIRIEKNAVKNNSNIHKLRIIATEKLLSFFNWIIFDSSNQGLKNAQRWEKVFSKSFCEIKDTDWKIDR